MKVAVIQHPPKYLNLTKSMDLAVELIQTAAKKGSKLIVFPEAWFPGYPEYVWRLKPGAEMSLTDDLFKISQANSIDLSKDQMKPIQDAAKKNKVVIVAGYQEIDGEVSGSTLFCSCIIINNDGSILNNHRKLMPTNPERMVWGPGDGSGLNVVETPVGRIGTLACWENYMPLARYSLYSQNIDIYIVDTFGETKLFHKISSTVFLGGSIIKRGGQNPLEAARLGSKILHGPNTDNFKVPTLSNLGINCSKPFSCEIGIMNLPNIHFL